MKKNSADKTETTVYLLTILIIAVAVLAIFGSRTVCQRTGSDQTAPVDSDSGFNSVRISELMASNEATLSDSKGCFADWLELYNSGDTSENLEGYCLRCGSESWSLPAVTLEADSYLVIFCDGADQTVNTDLHSSFSISAAGEAIRLTGRNGETLDVFPATEMARDCSAWRDEAGNVHVSSWPTPGFENTEAGYVAFQCSRRSQPDSIVLSEAMVRNDSIAPLEGQYYDWIEFYNPTDHFLNLGDYCISDREKDRMRHMLPDRDLAPGAYALLYCDSDLEGQIPFNLNAEREAFYLSRRDGTLCDYALLRDIPYGCSFGRAADGSFVYFETPTPGSENRKGVHFTGEEPELLGQDGIFDGMTDVIAVLSGKGTIRYTVDGSEPKESSYEYIGPMRVPSTCVIRAASFQEDHLRSEILSLSYLIGEGHSLPVVSLVCDSNQLFAKQGGLYYSPDLELEIPAAVMFYEEDGQFRSDCGLKLHGATSRYVQEKKSLKLTFQNRYDGELSYELFKNGVEHFSSILLRSGQEGRSSSYMRDALMHELAEECFPELPSQAHRYTALYINGRYWGLYNLREAHSEEHYANHYGYNVDTVTQWREKWDKNGLFEEVYLYAMNHDLTYRDDYEYVASHLNIDSVIGWLILQDYSGNFDFNSPNMRFYWSEEDQKLCYALVDLDLGMFKAGSLPALTYRGYYDYNKLAGALMKNAEFRSRFCMQLNEALKGPMSDEAVLARINRIADEIRPEIAREKARWGGRPADWEKLIEDIRAYVTVNRGRARNMVRLMVLDGALKTAEAKEYLPEFMK